MTLLSRKFDYQPIQRKNVNGKRKYLTPDGNAVASVTTILDATKDKTALLEWRRRVGEKKAQEITTEASGIGTRLHKYIEDLCLTGKWPNPGSNPYAQQAHAMADIIRKEALPKIDEIWGVEVPLFVPGIYAGTTDLVGCYQGNPAICDFKQTNRPKKVEWVEDYYLQLTAYALAHNEVYGTDIKEGHIFMCSRNFEYQQFDLWPDEFSEWEQEWWNRCSEYYKKVS